VCCSASLLLRHVIGVTLEGGFQLRPWPPLIAITMLPTRAAGEEELGKERRTN